MRDVEQAVEVHRHDVLPVLDHGIGIARKTVAPVDAGIVDQDRDRADLACDLCRDLAASNSITDVEGEILRLAAGVTDIGRRLRGGIRVDVERGNMGALFGEAKCNGAADARARAGDNRNVIVKKPRYVWCPPLFDREHSNSLSQRVFFPAPRKRGRMSEIRRHVIETVTIINESGTPWERRRQRENLPQRPRKLL
jgi:hypothetical protein